MILFTVLAIGSYMAGARCALKCYCSLFRETQVQPASRTFRKQIYLLYVHCPKGATAIGRPETAPTCAAAQRRLKDERGEGRTHSLKHRARIACRRSSSPLHNVCGSSPPPIWCSLHSSSMRPFRSAQVPGPQCRSARETTRS